MKPIYINGEFTTGRGQGESELTNPASEKEVDSVPRGTAEGVKLSVRSARTAFDP